MSKDNPRRGSEARRILFIKPANQEFLGVPEYIELIEQEESDARTVEVKAYTIDSQERESDQVWVDHITPNEIVVSVREQYQLNLKIADVLKLLVLQMMLLTVLFALGVIKVPMMVVLIGMIPFVLWIANRLATKIRSG